MQSDEGLWASPLVSSLWLDLGPESLAVIVDSPPGMETNQFAVRSRRCIIFT